MSAELLLEGGKAMASYLGKEQESNKLIGKVAKLLSSAVERILKEVATLLKKSLSEAFTKNKLDGAVNLASTISELWEDYNRNPDGSGFRLQEIELRSLDLLATLDDEDVALVGVVHYITVATIRLCGLLEKGKAEPLELPGVIEKAEKYREYFQSLLPKLEQSIRSRVTRLVKLQREADPDFGGPGEAWRQYVGYILDGSPIEVTSYVIRNPDRNFAAINRASENAANKRVRTASEQAEVALIESIIGPMKRTVATWPV